MGVRGEIFSTKVALQNRTYFFNVKENRMGDLYLNIVESKNQVSGGFERQSVILFADDLQEFLGGFDESLRVLEKAVRERRKSEGGGKPKPRPRDDDKDKPKGKSSYRPKSASTDRPRPKDGDGKPRSPRPTRRVVVKKNPKL
jgi:hypothetical protein